MLSSSSPPSSPSSTLSTAALNTRRGRLMMRAFAAKRVYCGGIVGPVPAGASSENGWHLRRQQHENLQHTNPGVTPDHVTDIHPKAEQEFGQGPYRCHQSETNAVPKPCRLPRNVCDRGRKPCREAKLPLEPTMIFGGSPIFAQHPTHPPYGRTSSSPAPQSVASASRPTRFQQHWPRPSFSRTRGPPCLSDWLERLDCEN